MREYLKILNIQTIGSKLEIVYPIIRQKMAQALVSWTPSDHSAR